MSDFVLTEDSTSVAAEENIAPEESTEPAAEEPTGTAPEETPTEEPSEATEETSSSSPEASAVSSSYDASSSESSSDSEKKGKAGSSSGEDGNPLGVVCFIVLIVLAIILYRRFKKRCPNCKKWGAMKYERQETIKEQQIKMQTKTFVNGKEVVRNAPGTRRTIRTYFKCKYCPYEYYRDKTKDTVNE